MRPAGDPFYERLVAVYPQIRSSCCSSWGGCNGEQVYQGW